MLEIAVSTQFYSRSMPDSNGSFGQITANEILQVSTKSTVFATVKCQITTRLPRNAQAPTNNLPILTCVLKYSTDLLYL